MNVTESELPDVKIIEPRVFGDARGFFLETYSKTRYAEVGITESFVQDNHSRSQKNVLRGLHFQLNFPQGKLVSVAKGEVFDVAVDIRVGSPHFGRWFGARLSDENHLQLYIPPGFAHGFLVLSETADFLYKCTEYYHPEDDQGILWNDPEIAINWGVDSPSLSEKDRHNATLAELQARNKLPVYPSAEKKGSE